MTSETKKARHCPWIERLCLETRAPLGISLLGWVFQDLTNIDVLNEHLSVKMIMALLKHKETLNHLYTIEDGNIYLSETIPEVASNQLGLNTKERIDRSIQLWKEGREWVDMGKTSFLPLPFNYTALSHRTTNRLRHASRDIL
jgi:hypothetical protein